MQRIYIGVPSRLFFHGIGIPACRESEAQLIEMLSRLNHGRSALVGMELVWLVFRVFSRVKVTESRSNCFRPSSLLYCIEPLFPVRTFDFCLGSAIVYWRRENPKPIHTAITFHSFVHCCYFFKSIRAPILSSVVTPLCTPAT